ncbi:hypothetical protein GCM10025776_25880 [Corallincola platygyrae]
MESQRYTPTLLVARLNYWLSTPPDDVSIEELSESWVWLLNTYIQIGQRDEALVKAEQALKSLASAPPRFRVEVIQIKGVLLQRQGNYAGEQQWLTQQIEAQPESANLVRGQLTLSLAQSYAVSEQRSKAITTVDNALAIIREMQPDEENTEGWHEFTFNAKIYAASVLFLQGRFQEAYDTMLEAQEKLKAEDLITGLTLRSNIALVLIRLDRAEEALEVLQQLEVDVRRAKWGYGLFFVQFRRMMALHQLQRYQDANYSVDIALREISEIDEARFRYPFFMLAALIRAHNRNFSEANRLQELSEQDYDEFKALSREANQLIALGYKAELAKVRGQTQQALELYAKWANDLRKFNAIQQRESIATLSAQMDNAINKTRADLLTKQNILQERRLAEQRQLNELRSRQIKMQYALLLVLIVSLTLLTYFLWRLQQLAQKDSLTGVLNRRQIIRTGNHLVKKHRRSDTSLALMVVDVDHFKSINDNFGHPTGDHILRMLTKRIRQQLRRGDMFGRIGGEEFLILLPGCSKKNAKGASQRLLNAISGQPFQTDNGEIAVTVSMGLTLCQPDDSFESLYQRGDELLYQAKQAGRNRVEIDS